MPDREEQSMTVMIEGQIEDLNPHLRAWKVTLGIGRPQVVLATDSVAAIRMARFDWATAHRTTLANAPECSNIRSTR